MQVLMLKGLSLCPLMIRDFIAGLHLSLPLYLSPFYQFLSAKCFFFLAFQLKKGDFA